MAAHRSPWIPLPPELRFMILNEIVSELQNHRGWSSYATVCEEWRVFIERKNFKTLRLKPSCLEALNSTVIRQRHLVRFISLDVDLPPHPALPGGIRLRAQWESDCRNTTREVTIKVFSVLSSWNPTYGIGLRLWSKFDNSGPGGLGSQVSGVRVMEYRAPRGPDIEMGYYSPSGPCTPSLQTGKIPEPDILESLEKDTQALYSLYSSESESWRPLPEVRAVTQLLMCEEVRNHISLSCLGIMWQRLPRSKGIILMNCSDQVTPAMQRSLASSRILCRPLTDYSIEVSRMFASKSRELEALRIPHFIDAWQFFRACQYDWTWPTLRILTLSSGIMSQDSSAEDISNLLRMAGSNARNMPKLEHMFIFKAWAREFCYFRYQKNGYMRGTFNLKATWDFELSPDVVEIWEAVLASSSEHGQGQGP